ncbi:MAG: putative lipid II flippase FtsW [Phycisphaerae bacterium]
MKKEQLSIESPLPLRGYVLMLQGLVLALMGLGMVMIYSAQGRVDKPPLHDEFLNSPAGKQIIFAVVSVIMMVIFSRVDYNRFRMGENKIRFIGLWLVILAVILLVAVHVPKIGLEINGSKRWLKFGPVTFQPSEFAKLALVIYLAGKLTDSMFPKKEFFRGLIPLCFVIGIVCALVGTEDLGTAAVIAGVSVLMLLVGGVRVWHLILPVIPGLLGFVGLIIAKPYRLQRITTFLDPWKDPQGTGYHPIQSLIAIATGGWWGRGLGEGIQKYGYLPEDTTDFIFSIISEELGMVGGIAVLGIFAVLIIVGWLIYRQSKDDFGKMLVFGLIGTIGLQAVINVAVATVSMPTKGIALPFVSAGGSGLLFAAIAIGLISSVSRYSEYELLNEDSS